LLRTNEGRLKVFQPEQRHFPSHQTQRSVALGQMEKVMLKQVLISVAFVGGLAFAASAPLFGAKHAEAPTLKPVAWSTAPRNLPETQVVDYTFGFTVQSGDWIENEGTFAVPIVEAAKPETGEVVDYSAEFPAHSSE